MIVQAALLMPRKGNLIIIAAKASARSIRYTIIDVRCKIFKLMTDLLLFMVMILLFLDLLFFKKFNHFPDFPLGGTGAMSIV
jgi:hypothetical protein